MPSFTLTSVYCIETDIEYSGTITATEGLDTSYITFNSAQHKIVW